MPTFCMARSRRGGHSHSPRIDPSMQPAGQLDTARKRVRVGMTKLKKRDTVSKAPCPKLQLHLRLKALTNQSSVVAAKRSAGARTPRGKRNSEFLNSYLTQKCRKRAILSHNRCL